MKDSETSDIRDGVIPDEFSTNKNEFMMPPAGITNVTCATLGGEKSAAGVKKTTIQFTVHNFHDYDKIYSRYFLRPVAHIFLDFGWGVDGLGLYDPEEIIKDSNWQQTLFDSENGELNRAVGDWDIVHGYVANFTSTIGSTGEHKCSIELLSRNAQLWNISFDNNPGIANRLIQNMESKILEYAMGVLFGNETWKAIDDRDTLDFTEQDWTDIWAATASNALRDSSGRFNQLVLDTGVYWTGAAVSGDNKTPVPAQASNIFISWGFFEDNVLNEEFAKMPDQKNKKSSKNKTATQFNSVESWIVVDSTLLDRQKVMKTKLNSLVFLYPPIDDTYEFHDVDGKKAGPANFDESYNSLVEKRPDAEYGSSDVRDFARDNFTKYCNGVRKIPLRELFVSLATIKTAFMEARNSNDAITRILGDINSNSNNVFDLKITDTTIDSNSLGVQCNNTLGINQKNPTDMKSYFDKLFVFKPHSPNTIVQSMDIPIDQVMIE